MDYRNRAGRRKAFDEPGHAHELTFTCYRRFRFLAAERTCQWLVESIAAARPKRNFALWAFVFMPEHVHLIVCPRDRTANVSTILSAIKEPVGRKAVKYLTEHAPNWLAKVTRTVVAVRNGCSGNPGAVSTGTSSSPGR
jgi:putative transposase